MEDDTDLIRATDNPVVWAAFIHQLDDARVHLAELVAEMVESNQIDEIDLGIRMGHIYGHLNRDWNGRHLQDANVTKWYKEANCRFPEDVTIT